jgi:hypothetical protein
MFQAEGTVHIKGLKLEVRALWDGGPVGLKAFWNIWGSRERKQGRQEMAVCSGQGVTAFCHLLLYQGERERLSASATWQLPTQEPLLLGESSYTCSLRHRTPVPAHLGKGLLTLRTGSSGHRGIELHPQKQACVLTQTRFGRGEALEFPSASSLLAEQNKTKT